MFNVATPQSCCYISAESIIISEHCGSSNGYSNGFRNGTNGFAASSNGVTRSTNGITSIFPSSPTNERKCDFETPSLPFRVEALKLHVSIHST
jgi:hypothetical protein